MNGKEAIYLSTSARHTRWCITLNHTLREGNFAKDYLAKLGSNMDMAWEVYEQPHVRMEENLASDASRMPILRT